MFTLSVFLSKIPIKPVGSHNLTFLVYDGPSTHFCLGLADHGRAVSLSHLTPHNQTSQAWALLDMAEVQGYDLEKLA